MAARMRRVLPQGFINVGLPKTKFRCIRQGEGGTLVFRGSSQTDGASGENNGKESGVAEVKIGDKKTADKDDRECIRMVGTLGVRSCVGVYFAIDDNRCFIAHINAFGAKKFVSFERFLSGTFEENEFKKMVIDRLKQHAQKNGWCPTEAKSRILQTLLIICPRPADYRWPRLQKAYHLCTGARLQREKTKMTGSPIIDGIQEFLGVKGHPVEEKGGFILEHGNEHCGSRRLLPVDRGGLHPRHPELVKYEPVWETFNFEKDRSGNAEWDIYNPGPQPPEGVPWGWM